MSVSVCIVLSYSWRYENIAWVRMQFRSYVPLPRRSTNNLTVPYLMVSLGSTYCWIHRPCVSSPSPLIIIFFYSDVCSVRWLKWLYTCVTQDWRRMCCCLSSSLLHRTHSGWLSLLHNNPKKDSRGGKKHWLSSNVPVLENRASFFLLLFCLFIYLHHW